MTRAVRILLFVSASGFVATASASEPASGRARSPRIQSPTPLMWIGAGTFLLGYAAYALPAATCRFDCEGIGNLYMPFIGYRSYLVDAKRFERDITVDPPAHVAWVPTFVQSAGALLVLAGGVSQRVVSDRPAPIAQWTFLLRPGHGGALLGVVGAF